MEERRERLHARLSDAGEKKKGKGKGRNISIGRKGESPSFPVISLLRVGTAPEEQSSSRRTRGKVTPPSKEEKLGCRKIEKKRRPPPIV